MKTQAPFKSREWKELNNHVGLAQRDLNTPLHFQAYLCQLSSKTRLWINHPIVAEAGIHLQRKPPLTALSLWKQMLQNTRVHIKRHTWKPSIFPRSLHNTHTTGCTHKPATKKDTNTVAEQQKGRSACTDECTCWPEHTLPMLPHLLLLLPALSAKYWLAIKVLQRNLCMLMWSGFPLVCKRWE